MPRGLRIHGCPWFALVMVTLASCTPLEASGTPAVQDPDAAVDSSAPDADGGGRGGRGGTGGAGTSGSEAGRGGGGAGSGGAGSGGSGEGGAGQTAGVGGRAGEAGNPAPSGLCPDGSEPAEETCDGKDNDCDGETDEGLTRGCGPAAQGACKPGTETCENGSWGACTGAVEPADEVCDPSSVDENCDGARNEGCTCTEGMMQPCGNDQGICRPGMQVCMNGNWSTTCTGGVTPQRTEVCDTARLDENCNGDENENCECTNGQTEACTGNDVGACSPGTRACNDGRWSTCVGTVTPRSESCDDVDNDCDGTVDDNASGCSANQRCVDGDCVCVPQCQGKVCGSDGCSGTCAPSDCGAGSSCMNGQCVTNCGNRVIDPGEGCDDGVNSLTGNCPRCQTAFCGDGFILAGVEECEQRADGWNSTSCSPFCARTLYQWCDGSSGSCPNGNTNCSVWVSNDVNAATCATACNNDSSQCPSVGGFQATCVVLFCALQCDNGICPNKMRCAQDVPISEPSGNTRIIDVCVASPP